MPSLRRALLTALLLMLAAWVLYLPSIRYGFIYYDDVRILKEHPELYGQPTLSANLRSIFTLFPREEPLLVRDVSWALDSRLFGFGNPLGYHLGNVFLHGIAVGLMFCFLLAATCRYQFALLTTAAFLILAVHVEPVAWIMGRKDILSTIFMLLALCAQTRRLTTTCMGEKTGWYLLTLAFFLAGLLSKINVLTFPLVLLLYAIFLPYLRREQPPSSSSRRKEALINLFFKREPPYVGCYTIELLLLLPALVISGFIYVWYQRSLEQMGVFERGYTAHGLAHLWNLLMIDPLVVWRYLQQILFPFHLSVLYIWPGLEPSYPLWQIIISFGTIVAAAGIGVWLFRRCKDWFFFYAVFFVLMLPYMNLRYLGIWVADRYVYFSAFCILALLVSLGEALLQHRQQALRVGVVCLCGGFAIVNLCQAFSYQPAWRNAETLWQYHIALPRPAPAAFANLAAYYYSTAAEHPDSPATPFTLKKMSVVIDSGINEFWRDRAQSPPASISQLFFLKSILQEVSGELEAALQSLLVADQLKPRFDSTNLNLARLYRKLAQKATDSARRRTYACSARDRFKLYIELAFRGRATPPEVQAELKEMEAECTAGQ